jgi:5-formyltetrahydrofolate cyclo-ligase
MAERDHSEAAEQALRVRAKAELRSRLRSVRRVMPQASCDARSRAICERLVALPQFARASVIAGYAAFRKEADPADALRQAEAAGKQIALVRIADDGALALHAHRAGDVLAENGYGILEPPASAPRVPTEAVELIIVPALAVDARGHRIGYGHGYYDRLLPRLERAYKVAIAYDFQLMAEAPDTPGDVPVDCVITDQRTIVP